MSRASTALLITCCGALSPLPALAGTYNVRPGDDLANLLSGLQPGDEVIFAEGTYEIAEQLTISELEGDAASPTVLRAEDGALPTLQLSAGVEGAFPGSVLTLNNVKGVELRGLRLLGADSFADEGDYYGLRIADSTEIHLQDIELGQTVRSALRLDGLSSLISAEGLHVHDVRSGSAIRVGCSDASCFTTGFTLRLSQVHDVGPDGYGVELYHGSQAALIEDTVMYDLQGRGLYFGSTEDGEINVAEGNAIWSVSGHAVLVEGAARLRNNIVFNIGEGGLLTRDPGRGTFANIVMSHNTVVNTTGWAADLQGWVGATGMVLANNALCNPLGYGVKIDATSENGVDIATPGYVSRNIGCGLMDGPDPLEPEVLPGGGYTDFLNEEIWEFYPTETSTLIDSADATAEAWIPELDFNGVQREGDAPDVGAYEWDGEFNPGWAIQEDFKDLTLRDQETPEGAVTSGCCSDQGEKAGLLLIFPALLHLGRRRRGRSPRR